MHLISTHQNERLARSVRARMAAEGLFVASQVWFWRFLGIGFVALGLGTATGFAFYGYSYITRNTISFDALSFEITKRLSGVELKAKAQGVVQIEPSEISLADGQTVALDRESRVRLDAGASIRTDGDIRIQGPTVSMPRVSTPSTPQPPMIANFTVFKRVPFDGGHVMTGWVFLTSVQKSPSEQYCYYTGNTETPGLDVVLHLGTDGKFDMTQTSAKFDAAAAFNRCVWFRDQS